MKNSRPTSPHLTIYKKQISSVLSIFHRMSGAFLFCFMTLFSWYFIGMIFSDFAPCILSILNYKMTKVIFYCASVAIFYHLCTGIRHLFWDMGVGFQIPIMNRTGWIAVNCCIIFTLLFWIFIV